VLVKNDAPVEALRSRIAGEGGGGGGTEGQEGGASGFASR
jgi:hypothetical protein